MVIDKTVAVLFTRRVVNNNVILKFNGNTINTANSAKFIVIIFDSKLTWSEHISYMKVNVRSVSTSCGALQVILGVLLRRVYLLYIER